MLSILFFGSRLDFSICCLLILHCYATSFRHGGLVKISVDYRVIFPLVSFNSVLFPLVILQLNKKLLILKIVLENNSLAKIFVVIAVEKVRGIQQSELSRTLPTSWPAKSFPKPMCVQSYLNMLFSKLQT